MGGEGEMDVGDEGKGWAGKGGEGARVGKGEGYGDTPAPCLG